MTFVLQPWQLYLVIVAGWIHCQQQEVIEYLRTENQILKEKLDTKRILLSDDQRRRLAVKGKILGRKRLEEVGTLFTPDTILRWHRMLVAKKYDYSERRQKVGRPVLAKELVQLVLRFASANPNWGYDRIAGAVQNLGHDVSDQSVGNLLKEHGIEPVPTRARTKSWSTFLKAHWDVLAAIDFTTIEVWTKGGIVTYYLLFVMELKTRRVHFAGYTAHPDETWMKQIARHLTNCEDGFLIGNRYLLMDRDTKFCESFRDFLGHEGVEAVQLPPKSPNLNAHLERFMRSIKSECLEKMTFFRENMLRNAVRESLSHYHHERNHQGLENKIIAPGLEVGQVAGKVECRERLGGMLRYYYRGAA
ncbi:MAG: DDE-type integrase/transposase/recombinase [Planctomycetaceae bacterium]|nr:DDE-type integrase/transposase/recombinase [Planctomycetaceae bacterium]